ncbi:MAG: HNH endonuclease, partial [Nostoc sp.]
GFNFLKTYGDIGADYIECHHTKPISELENYEKTNIKDLALVCANCHRMLHRKRPWLSIEQLKQLLK